MGLRVFDFATLSPMIQINLQDPVPGGAHVLTTQWKSAKGEHTVETIVGGSREQSVDEHDDLVKKLQVKYPKIE